MVSPHPFRIIVALLAVAGTRASPCKPDTSSLATTETSAAISRSFEPDTTSSATTEETFLSEATDTTTSPTEMSATIATESTELEVSRITESTGSSTAETTMTETSTAVVTWSSETALSSTTTDSTTEPATTTTTTSAPTETNVLVNGGFDVEPAAIDPWILAPKNGLPNTDATISLTDEAHDGSRALRLVYSLPYGWAWIHQPVPENLLLPGVKYTFSVQVLHHRGPEWQLCWRAGMACLYGANGATLTDNAEAIGIDSWYRMKISCTWTAAQLAQGNIKIAMGAASCAGANMIFDTAVLAEAQAS